MIVRYDCAGCGRKVRDYFNRARIRQQAGYIIKAAFCGPCDELMAVTLVEGAESAPVSIEQVRKPLIKVVG